MKMIALVLVLFCFACNPSTSSKLETVSIIPQPQQLELREGHFVWDENTTIFYENDFKIAVDFLKKHLIRGAGIDLKPSTKEEAHIVLEKDTTLDPEGYILDISPERILIACADPDGAFWAIQSLRQLLPESLEHLNSLPTQSIYVPLVKITDAPKFTYRGMHLDVGRHFFPKEFIKEYISYLSLLKMNYFHWHLTEDQGWRIEIKQYPDLTSKGAFRDETLIGHYNDIPQQFDGKPYGGFYTQEDVKEIVAFAQAHNVTIIPEIEMPGHAQAAISAYPELSCTGKQIPVATSWGVFETIYCPNQKTFAFLKNVLTEVTELFPGKYIHIGGDEAPKAQWKSCAHCQRLIKDLNLKDEHGLQSYFIKEMERFVNSKGKSIIGWDEILEGGLAPNATVMSWRGTQGAIAAAKEGHDVILTPTSHAYFDYYQADHEDEPLAIGGFLPLEKVYSFDPVPPELTAKEAVHVLGAQGNVWTEYMPTVDQVEYMAFPRMLAMSEVVWKGASEDNATDYPEFLLRVEGFMPRMDALQINYANHLYDVSGKVIRKNDSVFYELATAIPNKEIRYSIGNDSTKNVYKNPIPISESSSIHANIYKEGRVLGKPFSEKINYHKGITAKVTINHKPHPAYAAGGKEALINGVAGSDHRYGDKEWLGFWGEDLEITIAFSEPTEIKKVATRFYNANGQWIYAPDQMIVHCILDNGIKMINGISMDNQDDRKIVDSFIDYSHEDQIKVTKIIVKVPNYGVIPKGLQGTGNKAWTFIDEIIIE